MRIMWRPANPPRQPSLVLGATRAWDEVVHWNGWILIIEIWLEHRQLWLQLQLWLVKKRWCTHGYRVVEPWRWLVCWRCNINCCWVSCVDCFSLWLGCWCCLLLDWSSTNCANTHVVLIIPRYWFALGHVFRKESFASVLG